MEEKSVFETFELNFSNQITGYLKEISTWSYFLSIIGFIGIGFMVLFGALFGTILGDMPNDPYEAIGLNMGYFGLIYIVIALVYFFPVLYLFNFSRKMKSALATKNNDDLSSAFGNLKSHYKFLGIFTIVIISLYLLMFVAAFIGSMV
ncbi:MAG: hypothetical protein KDD03_07990 [Gelidibacter sp.]|nr:hypothetical protein [Gelidibacter sp.]